MCSENKLAHLYCECLIANVRKLFKRYEHLALCSFCGIMLKWLKSVSLYWPTWYRAPRPDNVVLHQVNFYMYQHAMKTPQVRQEIWANAHATRDSISLILYAGCLGLHPVISAQFTVEMRVADWNREKITKPFYFGVQGHRCWYHRKARQQCLLW